MSDFVCPVCGCTEYYKSKESSGRVRIRCKSCQKERMRKIYASEEYKKKHRIDDRRRRRGCSAEEYDARLEKQSGKCAICGKLLWQDLRVDHNHLTGKVRGLLCDNCNCGLGFFKDNPSLLRRAADYLDEE